MNQDIPIIQTSKDIGFKTLCEGIETKEQEEAIVKLRQTDEYARCSLGEVVRQLINAGLEVKANDA